MVFKTENEIKVSLSRGTGKEFTADRIVEPKILREVLNGKRK